MHEITHPVGIMTVVIGILLAFLIAPFLSNYWGSAAKYV